jgi:predicted regulator of amino acid metabolism with ACT domain
VTRAKLRNEDSAKALGGNRKFVDATFDAIEKQRALL